MAKIVKLTVDHPHKFGLEKVRPRKRRPKNKLEEAGQLNIFSTPPHEARVVEFQADASPFEQAIHLDDQNDDQARELYLKAIKSGDCIADAFCNLGILEFGQGNTIKAIDCFTNSLKHDPRHFESHYNLANVYSDVGNYGLAKTHYEISSQLDPDFPNIYFNLGLVYAMTKDFKSALESLSRYKEMAPEIDTQTEELLESLKKSIRV